MRILAQAIRRLQGRRKALPAAVAGAAVLGVVAGVTVSVASGPGSPAPGTVVAPATSVSASVAGLPPVKPVTGNAPVVDYASITGAASAMAEGSSAVLTAPEPSRTPQVEPLKHTYQADLVIVSPTTLPSSVLAAVAKSSNVVAAEPVEAVQLKVNGTYTAVLGVDPSSFRSFAAKPTAASDALWQGVAGGGVAVSYTMGKLDKLPLGGKLTMSGKASQQLKIVAFGTLGIGGVDAVVSHDVARSLGAPADNAIVVSIRGTDVAGTAAALSKLVPHGASVKQLVSVTTTGSGAAGAGTLSEPAATNSQISAMLAAAMSRRGLPYVWGGDGPNVFDCSGLVQWSFRQAGITMPRVAADQARTGPAVPVSELQPGDLLFYHTDPSAPTYISHVAIYLGNGWMLQAPQPGENVEVVPASFGSEFAGAVRVDPAQAAQVAGI